MHTYWVRANAVFFYGLNVLLGLAIAAWASCLTQDLHFRTEMPLPVIEAVRINELLSLRAHGGSDRALISFDLQADLRPTFHWNLKQLFVFVLASYESEKNPINQVILWDKIVETEEDALLDESKVYVKYALIDQINGLRNTTVNISLVWDHMPVTGRLFMQSGQGSSYTLPTQYI
ncbi:signal peptidase 22kDa subunit [Pelagophyceae sp. CCMP2097]|nr:signal peptidase 22kDa subunit [Pelagophyceae sp. CCMP2097]|mmetsp:Transcript_6788/g.21934  ORF Transcript_6788/g.21934 Transcript_6788/m.21934 type:complete len:176 (+) Transcript_6788:41-568(+)